MRPPHPSLPNYLALTSGSTLVARDCSDCTFVAHNLSDELERAGISRHAYMAGMPLPVLQRRTVGGTSGATIC